MLALQRLVGNRATSKLLTIQCAMDVGADDDPAEREARTIARRVARAIRSVHRHGGPSEATEEAPSQDGAEIDAAPYVGLERLSDGPPGTIGAEGGEVSDEMDARIRAARSGGAPLEGTDRSRLERAFGGADFGRVRLHDGAESARLNAQFGARAFTTGSDIFFRDRVPTLTSSGGAELLAHELAHTLQQAGGQARRNTVHRDFVADWDSTYAKLTATGKKGYDQFVALNGASSAERARVGAIVKDGDKKGQYDTDRAESMWSKKVKSDEEFADALASKQKRELGDVKARLTTMNHLCDETDGTNRPGSVGDGTSEWALKWEAEHGEPFRSPAGHAYKLRDYCKVLKEGLDELKAKQGSVPATEKMQWAGAHGGGGAEVKVREQMAAVVARATERLAKMREGVKVWNGRISAFPSKWNADGTSKLTPPGVDPLAKGQLQAGWPKDKTVMEY